MSGHRESVEQAEWIQVHQNAYRSARAAEQARTAKEWATAGALLVETAIGLTDALTINLAGVRCARDDHALALDLLNDVLPQTEGMQGNLEYLRSLIEDEARVAKTGEPYTAMDVTRMAAQLARYRTWVEGILRP